MANNRIYIQCKTCKEEFMLGKTFGCGYGSIKRDDWNEELYLFFEKHSECDCNDYAFQISYEHPEQIK